MLYNIGYVLPLGPPMAVNHKSGRVVVELDPALKHALHAALAADGLSLKEWLESKAEEFVEERRQPRLVFGGSSPPVPHSVSPVTADSDVDR